MAKGDIIGAGRPIDPGFQNNPFMVKEQFKNGQLDEIEMYFFWKYYNIAISRFEWVNLPEEIEPFFLEDVLFWRGKGIFIKDRLIEKYAFMKSNLAGLMDIYNIPQDRFAYANTGYIEEYGKEDSVLLYNNPLTMPTFYACQIYSKLMSNLWKTRDMNIYNQRTPIIAVMNESDRLSYENVINKYNQYIPVIKVSNSFDMKNLTTLDLSTPYIAPEMDKEMMVIENQLFTELGIENNSPDKKERVVTKEADGNDGKIEMYRNTFMCTRERFCKAANDLFGLNISVKFRSGLATSVNIGGDVNDMGLLGGSSQADGKNNNQD